MNEEAVRPKIDSEEFKDKFLEVIVIPDNIFYTQADIFSKTCSEIKDIKDVSVDDLRTKPSAKLDIMKIDGTEFVHSRTNNYSARVYFIFVLDCENIMPRLNKPKAFWDMEFVQELENFRTEDVKIQGLLFSTTADTETLFIDGFTHLGVDQKPLPLLFMVSFIVFLMLNILQFQQIYKN